VTHVPHELAEEFPEYKDRIHDLKVSSDHFAALSDQYHAVNREIHRIEIEAEPATDEYTEDLKKKRLALKDEIFTLLKAD